METGRVSTCAEGRPRMSALISAFPDGRSRQEAGGYEIRHGEYAAVVTARAGALRRLTYRGRDLVVPFPHGHPIPDYRGIVAAPWPNRIADGVRPVRREFGSGITPGAA
ncbi:hypothetical protein J2S89_000532 [Arthrobacter bambusae]|nr:hypothetical protein [Arthrobacter bambusae]MDQ0096482.1 hypothetical protein [Arthrobacter bambusae]